MAILEGKELSYRLLINDSSGLQLVVGVVLGLHCLDFVESCSTGTFLVVEQMNLRL